jgi:hypothetical protein
MEEAAKRFPPVAQVIDAFQDRGLGYLPLVAFLEPAIDFVHNRSRFQLTQTVTIVIADEPRPIFDVVEPLNAIQDPFRLRMRFALHLNQRLEFPPRMSPTAHTQNPVAGDGRD